MQKEKKSSDRFADLTWDHLEDWAGNRIVSRGRTYQRQNRVSGLAVTNDGSLVAWVEGSQRYATKVNIGDKGLRSTCTCPYESDCKHAVAVVLEYLERIEGNKRTPKVTNGDERLEILGNKHKDAGNVAKAKNIRGEIDNYLKGKSKSQLTGIILELADKYPAIGQNLYDCNQLTAGHTKTLVARLRGEIRKISEEPGWHDYWQGEGYTPDYSEVRKKLEALLTAGCADDVLSLGEELLEAGNRQVEMSDDEGETAMEIAACMPVVVKALEQSSLKPIDKLVWAVDAVLTDEYELCNDIAEYLMGQHINSNWSLLADILLERLNKLRLSGVTNKLSRDYTRGLLSDWAIYALEQAGRKNEIIPLCEVEAKKTGSYERLVNHLIADKRFEDAEHWIKEGIRAVEQEWPGIADSLRGKLREIRTRQRNWHVVSAMCVDEFVRLPSQRTYTDCKKAADRVKVWPKVRECLLAYLESGLLPWKQQDWPLPPTGLTLPDKLNRSSYPMINELIDIAILEKQPDQVLRWYDQCPRKRFGWAYTSEDDIATAVRIHAPHRAVDIWKQLAEEQIAQAKPNAYLEAARYLRKAAQVMAEQNKQMEWDGYLYDLREKHIRKRRLIEILDSLDGQPIIKRKP